MKKKIKQDCESKAFIRVAEKIKKQFPRLPIIITADGLYVSQKVIQTCTDNSWNYIIRYKKGSASSIAKEYQSLPEKEKIGSEIEYQNQIMFQNTDVNLTYYTEKKIKPDEKKETTEFAWIADITITKQCQKNSKCGKKQMEDRKSEIQPAEALAGEYRACMQLE